MAGGLVCLGFERKRMCSGSCYGQIGALLDRQSGVQSTEDGNRRRRLAGNGFRCWSCEKKCRRHFRAGNLIHGNLVLRSLTYASLRRRCRLNHPCCRSPVSKNRLVSRLAPAQQRYDRRQHSRDDFKSHPGGNKPGEIESGKRKSIRNKIKNIEDLPAPSHCANNGSIARGEFCGRLGSSDASWRKEFFYGSDQSIIELAWRRLRRCPVQSRDQFLLSWVQNFIRQAVEVPECPQKVDSRPAESLRMHHTPAGIEGHKNPSGEQERDPAQNTDVPCRRPRSWIASSRGAK